MEQQTLKEAAQAYEAPSTHNVADLEIVRTEWPISERKGKNSEGEEFTYRVVEHDHKDYRIPGTVLGAVKDILAERPDLKTFKVIKSGKGMQTRYTVVPIE